MQEELNGLMGFLFTAGLNKWKPLQYGRDGQAWRSGQQNGKNIISLGGRIKEIQLDY